MTITEFLLARIAEDEAIAEGWGGAATEDQHRQALALGDRPEEHWTRKRALAECEAKRRIVESHPVYRGPRLSDVGIPGADYACELCHAASNIDEQSVIEMAGPCDTLCLLAAIYADHPDYSEAWRP